MTGLLTLDGLSVAFSGLQALKDVSFSLPAGRIHAVIGPNGAGKTTLFNAITGFVRPSEGAVILGEENIAGLTPHQVAAKGVRRTFQNGGLFGDMTVLENVLAGLHVQVESGLFGLVLGGRRAAAAEHEAVERARELLELMELRHIEDEFVRNLSGGQQRMVEIVRALATNPPLLLLDEPAVGLALPVRETLMSIIRKLAAERNIGILLIEHAIDLVMNVSDTIIVLSAGQKIAEGTPEEVRSNRTVVEAYLGYA